MNVAKLRKIAETKENVKEFVIATAFSIFAPLVLLPYLVYPLIKSDKHQEIKSETFLSTTMGRNMYVFDYIIFHGHFANLAEELDNNCSNEKKEK